MFSRCIRGKFALRQLNLSLSILVHNMVRDNVRYWSSERYALPVSLLNGIWECCDDSKVQRGTGSKTGLRRLELAILRTKK